MPNRQNTGMCFGRLADFLLLIKCIRKNRCKLAENTNLRRSNHNRCMAQAEDVADVVILQIERLRLILQP